MNNYDFERSIVSVIAEIIDSRGLKHEPLAEEAWPDKKDAGRTWQDIRNKVPPQKLTMRDAYGLARVLNLSMSAICGIVEGRAIQQQAAVQAACQEKKKQEEESKTCGCPPTEPLERDPIYKN